MAFDVSVVAWESALFEAIELAEDRLEPEALVFDALFDARDPVLPFGGIALTEGCWGKKLSCLNTETSI